MENIELKSFLKHNMRMSHIYQPLMIRYLLENGGKVTDRQIAEEILKYDPSQIEYYQNIVNNMVGKVLRNRKVILKNQKEYFLRDYQNYNNNQIKELIEICNKKITDFINIRGEIIWNHRRKNRGYVSGSIRYEVLKRANFKCELCGISASEKALEVDHIVPKNLGGENSINNYQALCYTCNSNKRDTDKTDFRNNGEIFHMREKECLFCNVNENKIILKNNLAFLIRDNFPVSKYHSLIIPKRHFEDFFEIRQAELNAINQLLITGKNTMNNQDSTVRGYNIGINCGKVAGQTIMHCHIHLIPRYENDVDDPTGGVRNIIPNKGTYLRNIT